MPPTDPSSSSRLNSRRISQAMREAARESELRSPSRVSDQVRVKQLWWDPTSPGHTTVDFVGEETIVPAPPREVANIGEYLENVGEYLDSSSLARADSIHSANNVRMSLGQGEYFQSVGEDIETYTLTDSTPSLDEINPSHTTRSQRLFQHQDQANIDMASWILPSDGHGGSWDSWESRTPRVQRTTVRRTPQTLTLDTASVSSIPSSVTSSVVVLDDVLGTPVTRRHRKSSIV